TFAADRHPGESSKPGSAWNLWLRIEPRREQAKLVRWDGAVLNAVEKVSEHSGWKVVPADFRHSLSRRRIRAPVPRGSTQLQRGPWRRPIDQPGLRVRSR